MTVNTDVLMFAATIILGIATWYIKQVDAKIVAAFKRLDKIRIFLLKKTEYTEEED